MSRFELEKLAEQNGTDEETSKRMNEDELYSILSYHTEGRGFSGNADMLYESFGLA